MKHMSVRELRKKTEELCRHMEAGEVFVVTRNGRPFAMLLPAEPGEVAAMIRSHRAARLDAVVTRIQARAHDTGADQLTEAQVQAEIDAARKTHRRRAKDCAR